MDTLFFSNDLSTNASTGKALCNRIPVDNVPPGVDPKFANSVDSLELVDEEGMERLKTMLGDVYS